MDGNAYPSVYTEYRRNGLSRLFSFVIMLYFRFYLSILNTPRPTRVSKVPSSDISVKLFTMQPNGVGGRKTLGDVENCCSKVNITIYKCPCDVQLSYKYFYQTDWKPSRSFRAFNGENRASLRVFPFYIPSSSTVTCAHRMLYSLKVLEKRLFRTVKIVQKLFVAIVFKGQMRPIHIDTGQETCREKLKFSCIM